MIGKIIGGGGGKTICLPPPPPNIFIGGGGRLPPGSTPLPGGGGRVWEGCVPLPRGGGTYFHLGGGGAKTKKGTIMFKRALTVYMRIIITNALMKHHCRHKVSFYMFSVVFFSWGNYKI